MNFRKPNLNNTWQYIRNISSATLLSILSLNNINAQSSKNISKDTTVTIDKTTYRLMENQAEKDSMYNNNTLYRDSFRKIKAPPGSHGGYYIELREGNLTGDLILLDTSNTDNNYKNNKRKHTPPQPIYVKPVERDTSKNNSNNNNSGNTSHHRHPEMDLSSITQSILGSFKLEGYSNPNSTTRKVIESFEDTTKLSQNNGVQQDTAISLSEIYNTEDTGKMNIEYLGDKVDSTHKNIRAQNMFIKNLKQGFYWAKDVPSRFFSPLMHNVDPDNVKFSMDIPHEDTLQKIQGDSSQNYSHTMPSKPATELQNVKTKKVLSEIVDSSSNNHANNDTNTNSAHSSPINIPKENYSKINLKAKIIIGLPTHGRFDDKFQSDGKYKVIAPIDIEASNESKYLVFNPGSVRQAKKYGINEFRVNILLGEGKSRRLVAHGFAGVGQDVRMKLTDSLYEQIKSSSNVKFQVMALKENKTVASYNGIGTINNVQIANDNSRNVQHNGSLSKLIMDNSALNIPIFHQNTSLSNKTSNNTMRDITVYDSYISSRNLENIVLDKKTLLEFNKEFMTETFNAANLYKNAKAQGLSHAKSLAYAARNSEAAAIYNKSSAYEAIQYAQLNGHDAIFSRWDSRKHDIKNIKKQLENMRSNGKYKNKKEMYEQMREHIALNHGSNISDSSIRKILNII